MKLTVLVREVHARHVVIEATSAEEAKVQVRCGKGETVKQEYMTDMSPDLWEVWNEAGDTVE